MPTWNVDISFWTPTSESAEELACEVEAESAFKAIEKAFEFHKEACAGKTVHTVNVHIGAPH